MKKNIIDEHKVFEINDNLELTVTTIGPAKSKIVIVDNFYKNPYDVRNLAISIPPTYNKRIINGLPGGRIDAFYQLDHFAAVYDKIIRDVYLTVQEKINISDYGIHSIFKNATFCCNVLSSSEIVPTNPHVDHRDKYRFASGIFLNTPDECHGGTSFYTYKGSQEGPEPNSVPKTKYITDSIDDWELIYLAEMKFNRMILYEQNILHTAYIKPGMFENGTYRLLQMFFI
jgi:hypothetical protein